MTRVAWEFEIGDYRIRCIVRENPPERFTISVEENRAEIHRETVRGASMDATLAWAGFQYGLFRGRVEQAVDAEMEKQAAGTPRPLDL
jgi:hypothetical protein